MSEDRFCPYSTALLCDDALSGSCEDCFVYIFMQSKDGKVGKARNYNNE